MFWPVLPLRVAPAARTEPTSFQRTSAVTRSVEPPARTLWVLATLPSARTPSIPSTAVVLLSAATAEVAPVSASPALAPMTGEAWSTPVNSEAPTVADADAESVTWTVALPVAGAVSVQISARVPCAARAIWLVSACEP